MDNEHGVGPVGTSAFEGVGVGVSEGVAGWAELEADQVVETVAPSLRDVPWSGAAIKVAGALPG